MGNTKPDYLRECMSGFGTVPIDAFSKAFCLVCANRECARSAANGMKFDRRVHTWYETLFSQVPRADDNDARYDTLRAKRFMPITPAIEVNTPDPMPMPIIQEISPPIITPEAPDIIPKPSPMAPVVQEVEGPPTPPKTVEIPPNVTNTPFVQGTMIGSNKEVVIQPGGTFTFGSDEKR
jgi:hypothetical protein